MGSSVHKQGLYENAKAITNNRWICLGKEQFIKLEQVQKIDVRPIENGNITIIYTMVNGATYTSEPLTENEGERLLTCIFGNRVD